jgi:hypothetical protein
MAFVIACDGDTIFETLVHEFSVQSSIKVLDLDEDSIVTKSEYDAITPNHKDWSMKDYYTVCRGHQFTTVAIHFDWGGTMSVVGLNEDFKR